MEDNKMQQARAAYKTLLNTMEQRGWLCKASDEDLKIAFTVIGEDLPMNFRVVIDPNRLMAVLYSPFSFNIPEDRIPDAALALCLINAGLYNGNFDLDITDGNLCFRIGLTFRESLITEAAFAYLLECAICLVDEYNDKLLMLAKGKLGWENFAPNSES